jgi:hypothetical protein
MAPLKTDCAAVGESGGGVGGPSTVWLADVSDEISMSMSVFSYLIMTMSLNVKLF